MDAKELRRLKPELESFLDRYAPLFGRPEAQGHAHRFVQGLLLGGDRRSVENIAEAIDGCVVRFLQQFISTAPWDPAAVLAQLRGQVAEEWGDPGAVLTVDETGFPKEGTKSVGVKRQYSGTLGRTENCQIGVFLGYATKKGRSLVDRALYIPKEWAGDAERRGEAGVPEGVGFATKIVQARHMIDRAVAAGVPARWVTADAVYGSDYHVRTTAEGHGLGYVAGVRADFTAFVGWRQVRAKALVAEVLADGWHRLSCGAGAKGPREYVWAVLRTNSPEPDQYRRWLLIRRSIANPDEVAYFACGGPPATTLAELVRVAGVRWSIEDLFELAKGDCGLDEYEVRSWTGWHRHVTPSLFALAVVAVIRSRITRAAKKGARGGSPRPSPKCGSCSYGWCGTACPRPRRCWRGRRGGANTSTGRDATTTAHARRNRLMGNYGCRTSVLSRKSARKPS